MEINDQINNSFRIKNYSVQGKGPGFIKFYRFIAELTSIESALLLGHFLNVEHYFFKFQKKNMIKQNYFFFCLQSHTQQKIFLSKPQQKKATDLLIEKELIITKRGIGNRTYYKINHKKFYDLFQKESLDSIENEENEFLPYDQTIKSDESKYSEYNDIMDHLNSEY